MRIYTYANCDSCRKALKFLKAGQIAFDNIPIRETPPSMAELQAMLKACGGAIRQLFNTSGNDYRAMNLSAKLDKMSEAEALTLLATHGNLVKRPFLIGEGTFLVGFREEDWRKALIEKPTLEK